MDWMQTLKAVFALAIVLGLILGLSVLLRRFGPQLLGRMSAPRGKKRLSVIETLVLDPARRLVLIRVDDAERLILLGEGRELGAPGKTVADDSPASARPLTSSSPEDELF
jgi:flagellar protein FliO/FliZ